MALTYPYPLAYFSDTLALTDLTLDMQRFDEMSGGGDGRQWTAELARPLWRATGALKTVPSREGRIVNARAIGLDGPRKSFLFADPLYKGPASGTTAGLGGVSVGSVGAERRSLSMTGLPAGFVLTITDLFTITHSGRVYMGQFMEGGTASEGGAMGQKEVRPYLPFGIGPGSRIELVRPYFEAYFPPGGWRPYTIQPGNNGLGLAVGASITILQKP